MYNQLVTPTPHEKSEWSRMAQDAYRVMRNDVGHTYSVAASLPRNGQMSIYYFDALQGGYRLWLLDGKFPPAWAVAPDRPHSFQQVV